MFLLGILGTILKIIGIILLTILILILVLLFVFLLVPLRYRIQLSKEGEKIEAAAEVSYFLRFVRLCVAFRENRLSYRAKVLCFTCLSSDAKKPPRKRTSRKQKQEGENPEEAESQEKIEDSDKAGSPEKAENIEKAENSEKAESLVNDAQTPANNAGKADTEKNSEEETRKEETRKEESTKEESAKKASKGTDGVFRRILKKPKEILEKIRKMVCSLIEKVAAFLDNIRGTVQKACSFVQRLREKSGYIKEFLQDEVNKNGIKYTGKTIFKLLKHVIPYKMKGEIQFGTGDAYSMGQILSVLGMFYPLYARNLKIEADFEAEAFYLEGKVLLKGRIRFGHVLFLLIKLWFQGKLKKCWGNVMALKDRLIGPASMK